MVVTKLTIPASSPDWISISASAVLWNTVPEATTLPVSTLLATVSSRTRLIIRPEAMMTGRKKMPRTTVRPRNSDLRITAISRLAIKMTGTCHSRLMMDSPSQRLKFGSWVNKYRMLSSPTNSIS